MNEREMERASDIERERKRERERERERERDLPCRNEFICFLRYAIAE